MTASGSIREDPQLYGTQFLLMDGKNQPRPIEDPEHVDERREEMGMSTLAEYMETLQG
ncbi:MAG: hypothetical protein IH987_18820 [Planctomycetes bacterium]|nr:hypothetical protein [Planctomycetota bacterium]